ncbi:hypothetical protein [Vagococcus silagei]|uniref:Uncharacterized protein n=1 Tax=Vagococcus silagei TaxID=2508885 RepID=A0A4S3B4Z9_9ENTE|nr:hypothetical protein [Vagococcus silagei]THB60910.1 hypothetical protein ESZ54_08060 [Vagococcus silagei]
MIKRGIIIDTKEAWVKNWLLYCDEKNIVPWEFDFKQCYLKNDIQASDSSLMLELDYLSNHLSERNKKLHPFAKENDKPHCDREPVYIYDLLDWNPQEIENLRGDCMNSFKTTFNRLLAVNKSPFSKENEVTWQEVFSEIPKLDKWYSEAKMSDIEKFYFNKHNLERLEKEKTTINLLQEIKRFSKLTHSIGNFIVLLSWMNQGRGIGNCRDYWDLTLKDLRDSWVHLEYGDKMWESFVKKYYLQPFVDSNYMVREFWHHHFENKVPNAIEEFEKFYFTVNLLIMERGKWITKILCEKLGLVDLTCYKKEELDKMANIRWFSEIITEE